MKILTIGCGIGLLELEIAKLATASGNGTNISLEELRTKLGRE